MKKTFSILLILLITLCSFSSSYASNETLDFLGRINSAQTASQIRTLIEARDDIKFDLSSIYCKDNIYGGLVGQNFASMTELNNCAMGLIIAEESEPKVALYCGSEQVTSLGTGDHKVVVAPLLREGVKIVAATYKGDTLNTYDIKTGSATQSTELSLGNMTGGETSKVIFLESLDNLRPLNSYELFYNDKIEIYVSPNGKADGDGSRAKPFDSLEAAQSYVRTINSDMNCDIRVNILPGDYYITEPLEFTEEDSGTNGFEIIWSGAYGDDLPMISGGVPVKEWSPYKDGIYKAHVDGVTEARQFYINGIPAQRAVSEGYYIGEMPYSETGDVKYTTPDIELIELEFEDYAGYAVRDVDGKGVASHPWTLTNPDFEFTFEVPVGGYYDVSYIAGFQSDTGSYSEVKLYVDGKLIGHNTTAGTLLEGYSYKYSDKITYSQPVHEFNTKKILLSEGTHSFSVDFSYVVGGNWYTYLLDSIRFTPTEIEQGFYLSGYDLPDFERPHELELVVPVLWAQQRLPVRDVIALPNEDRHIFAMDMPYYHSYINMVAEGEIQPDVGSWFYIENALELLDEPGEFWFDTVTGDVYYYPHNSSELTAEAYIPVSEGLMSIKGASAQSKVSNIRFTGLEFRHGAYKELSDTGLTTFQADCLMPHDAPGTGPSGTGYTTPSQIHIEYADNIVIENCRMSNLGSAALGMTMEEPTIVSDGLWSGEAKEISDNAGLYTSLRGLTECSERDEAFGTAYDWFGPNEVLAENDILIDCTDYNPGINVGYFAGYKEGEYLEPDINTRGKYRKLLSGFLETMWYKYDIEVPVAGRYRVELRYSVGKASKADTVYGYATVRATNNNGSNLNNIPLRGTEAYFVSQPSVRLGELNLPKGSNTIMLLNSGGSWGFDNIKLIYIGD